MISAYASLLVLGLLSWFFFWLADFLERIYAHMCTNVTTGRYSEAMSTSQTAPNPTLAPEIIEQIVTGSLADLPTTKAAARSWIKEQLIEWRYQKDLAEEDELPQLVEIAARMMDELRSIDLDTIPWEDRTEDDSCPFCVDGFIAHWAHIDDGICYRCDGKG